MEAALAIVIKTARTRSRDHGQAARNLQFEKKRRRLKR